MHRYECHQGTSKNHTAASLFSDLPLSVQLAVRLWQYRRAWKKGKGSVNRAVSHEGDDPYFRLLGARPLVGPGMPDDEEVAMPTAASWDPFGWVPSQCHAIDRSGDHFWLRR